jgi:hypothetical protein
MTVAAATAAVGMLLGPAAATAAKRNASAYRAHINALCRSYTPKFKRVEADMAAAKRAGDSHRYAYDLGVVLGLTLKQGTRIEHTPVPVDARTQMAKPLRLLHRVDLQLRQVLTVALAGDVPAFQAESAKLARLSAPLNQSFDAVGLRDCGSNQQ